MRRRGGKKAVEAMLSSLGLRLCRQRRAGLGAADSVYLWRARTADGRWTLTVARNGLLAGDTERWIGYRTVERFLKAMTDEITGFAAVLASTPGGVAVGSAFARMYVANPFYGMSPEEAEVTLAALGE